MKMASNNAEKVLAKIVSRHWKKGYKITFDGNLVNIWLVGENYGGGGAVMTYKNVETMSGQLDREQLFEMAKATKKIERDAERQFDLEDSDADANTVFLVSDDFIGVRRKNLIKRASDDCGCGCSGAGTCEIPDAVLGRYREVGDVSKELLSMAKEVLSTDVEEIGNKRNESEEHEPNE